MRRTSYGSYAKLTAFLISVALFLGAILFYVACLIAIHFTIAVNSALAIGPGPGKRTNPHADALLAGFAAAVLWILFAAVLLFLLTGSASAWPVGLILGLPFGLVVGWQVGSWQGSLSWSRYPGSLSLGCWSSRPFFVNRPYTVTALERTKHLACSGATGSGKSTLIRNLIVQDLRGGAGLCVIDPKDDLIDGILPHVPSNRVDDVILFDATDTERPLGLNPFAGVAKSQRSLAASEIISVFRRYFSDAWGARLEHVLRNVVLALLEVPDATLLDVPRMLLDRSFSQWALSHVENPSVREFFTVEYEEILRRRSDAIEPILNKVGPWLAYPELRNIIGQPTSSFDLRQVMDRGQVLFVRIPQGTLGEDGSNLLGALIVAKIQLAAQSRVDAPGHLRRPFHLYVDEFQNFATSSFTKILTEARAFGLGLVCVNQYPEQLSRDLQLAMVRNAATFAYCNYQRGQHTVEVMRQEDSREKKPRVFVVRPPSPLSGGDESRATKLREMSRQRYGRPTADAAAQETESGGHEERRTLAAVSSRDVEEE